MNLCFLGALSEKELPSDAVEGLDDIDILFVPIGGEGVLTPAEAYKVAVNLEPKIIIPCHFGSIGDKNALKVFLKEAGEENIKPEEKLTLKKKDLEGKKADVVVLAETA
jgi:L-ascorbate metabolism protein UlaG (beta-lactamase superfamily)